MWNEYVPYFSHHENRAAADLCCCDLAPVALETLCAQVRRRVSTINHYHHPSNPLYSLVLSVAAATQVEG